MELWYQQHSYLTSPAAVQSVESTISQAAAAGYTGVALWDSSLNDLNLPGFTSSYIQQVTAFAQSKGLKVMPSVFPYGYSNDILNQDPNLAEAQHVTGTEFQVNAAGTALNVINTFSGLQNAGFESGTAAWFSYNDAGVGVDGTVGHTGSASARISNAPANARLVQSFPVTPWRQYHFRIWAKTQNFTNTPSVYISDSADWNAQRLNVSLPAAASQGWTAYDFTLNSASSTSLTILMGEWGGASGTLWLDDVLLEETGLIYVIRRGGTPLRMYSAASPSTVYGEGKDFNAIADPEVKPGGFGDHWHTPPVVTLPSGTSLRPGQIMAIDYYAVVPIYSSQVGMCLTDPGVLSYLQSNINTLSGIFPENSPYLLEYDEMRHLNSCALCKAMNMTAGQLLGWNVQQSLNMFHSASPGSPLYFWSDMFDPNMNAHNDYFLAEGDISGSWNALPSNATIMNWNISNLAPSIRFFAGLSPEQPRAFRQVLAGFYDPADNNGVKAASTLLQQAAGIPGVVGLMYTTWVDNYSQLANFAAAARSAWPGYQTSVGVSGGSAGSIAGLVRDSAGNPIAGANIAAVQSGGLTVTTVSGANGGFQFANVAAGNWTVSASASNFTSASVVVAVSGGASTPATLTLTPASFVPVRINAGGSAYTDASGNVWKADAGFANGTVYSNAVSIAGTSTPALYQTERYCDACTLEYAYAVPNGTYILNLKFAEIWFKAAGQRVFNILINNQTYEMNFDITRLAGGANVALDRRYPINVSNGIIDIKLVPVISNPKVSAIEITQAAATPVRVNAGGGQITDPLGRVWSADTGFLGGLTYSTGSAISHTDAPAIYQTERYNTGTLEYKYAVTNGTWTVTLKFAEIWYNSAGQRVFNILINGTPVASAFDPYAAAGGADAAIDKQFQTTVTNGILDIQLVPMVSNPKLSAIEIFR